MPILHAIALGITQGLSEFPPISSSGHLILVPWLFGWHELDNNIDLKRTFDVALHMGTFVVAIVYFPRTSGASCSATGASGGCSCWRRCRPAPRVTGRVGVSPLVIAVAIAR